MTESVSSQAKDLISHQKQSRKVQANILIQNVWIGNAGGKRDTVGRLAETVVLAQDPWPVDPENIWQIRVGMTIL